VVLTFIWGVLFFAYNTPSNILQRTVLKVYYYF